MDTTFVCFEKRLFSFVGAGMFIFGVTLFVLTHSINMPIMANDIVAHLSTPITDTGQLSIQIMSEVTTEARSKYFDEKIKRKYPKAIITDVDKGVKHIKITKYYDGKPVRLNIVEIDKRLAKDYTLTPALASNTLHSRKTISTIAKNTNSIIALNATFFKPQTGVPLGTLMIDKKIYTGPIYDRVAFGIFDDGYDVARVKLDSVLKLKGREIKINNINQPRMLATYNLVYTSQWGKLAPPTPKYGIQVAVEKGRIKNISSSTLAIPENGFVVVGPASSLNSLKIGDKVELDMSLNPEWKGVKHIISGGPYLVKNGEVFVDMSAEKLSAIGGKNPRSAIGYTYDNDLILVAVDGREGSSVGMTLIQLAQFMKSIGCYGAINLDGGGSTVMYVNGKIVNKPQQRGGIPISNAIVLSKKG